MLVCFICVLGFIKWSVLCLLLFVLIVCLLCWKLVDEVFLLIFVYFVEGFGWMVVSLKRCWKYLIVLYKDGMYFWIIGIKMIVRVGLCLIGGLRKKRIVF